MGSYNVGEVWWTQFPFEEIDEVKRRPAIVIDEDTIAILAMMVSSKEKANPYSIEVTDWKDAGLPVRSWARIDRIIRMDEWRMEKKIGNLSERDLKKFMEIITEYITGTFHEFSLAAITNPEGRYLQVYDERWNCWLFPYFRSVDLNKDNVDKSISRLLKMDVTTCYVTHAIHCKYSVSDGVYKQYKHILYRLILKDIPDYLEGKSFELEGKRYSWMSIDELENDLNTMEKNEDVIAFVKAKCK